MDLDPINLLKHKGNDAFKLGNLEEALRCYTEAIEMIGPDGDNKTTAIILSNRTQLRLKMEMYQQALEDADKSLQCDPSFRKSTLRRAIANAELGNNSEAMKDLRKILALEPDNTTVRSWMKHVSEPVKMDSQLREAYVGHYFRRWMTDRRRMALEPLGHCDYVKIPVLRQSFLSVENSVFMRKVLSDSTVASGFPGVMCFKLPCWLITKRMRIDIHSSMLICTISYAALSTLYCVIQPIIKLFLGCGNDELGQQFGFMHKCAEVYHLDDTCFHLPDIGPKDILTIEEASSILTRLPYFPEVVKFKDKTFPMVDTLVIAPTQIVDMEFLKLWKRQQWGIKNIVALDETSNLLNFELFEGIVSNHVTHVRMLSPISSPNDFIEEDKVKQFKDNMQMLKRVFPMLNSITVGLGVTYLLCNFPGISHGVKRWIFYLIDKFVRRHKPDWCREFKVGMLFTGLFEPGAQPASVSLQPLEDLVKECRGETKQLKYIRLRGPTARRIGGFTGFCCFAAIEMATGDAEFQILFDSDPFDS